MANKKKNKGEKVKKKSGILKKIFILLLIVLIVLVGFIVYKTQKNGGGMKGLLSTLVGQDEEKLQDLEPLQVLLMGVSTDTGAKLTDTMIVATYNPKEQTASLLSIPRDTFIGKDVTKGGGNDKINSLYQKGVDKVLKSVNEITGLDLKYYMVIDNQALIELVDLIGGVDFEVPMDMYYTDDSQNLVIDLKKGMQKINGEKAEQLLRFRKNNDGTSYPASYGGDDIGRMKTQRNFMIETAKQTLQAKNIFKIKDIIDIVYEYVETNLSISTIKAYVPYVVEFNVEDIKSAVLPGVSVGPTNDPPLWAPYWFIQINKKETETLMEELYGSKEDENSTTNSSTTNSTNTTSSSNKTGNTNTSASNNNTTNTNVGDNSSNATNNTITKTEASKIKIEILNGSGSDKKLTEVKKQLTAKGYTISKSSNTTSTAKTIIINKTKVDSKFEDNIKEILGVGNISTSLASSSNVNITIIIGKDYEID